MTTDYGLVILAEKSPIIILLMYTLNMGLLLRQRWLGARLKEFLKDTVSSHSLILLIFRQLLKKPMANLSGKDLSWLRPPSGVKNYSKNNYNKFMLFLLLGLFL